LGVPFRGYWETVATNLRLVPYTQDQVFAEPILADFTRETGIRVRPVFDSEAVKTVALANRLLGREAQPTKSLAEDGTGRHTTVARQLIPLPGGALLVDTPGLREVQLWDAEEGIEQAFADVDELAADCRFNDCAHQQEPGCAVQAAIDEGRLPRERLESYRALQRELRRLAMKQDARLRAESRKERVAFARSLRKQSW